MKVINDPICTFCSPKVIGSFFHMFWECTPVAEFWKMVAFNLFKLFNIRLSCSPAILILNDLSDLGLTLDKCLLDLRLEKKLVATRWKPPHSLSFRTWVLTHLDIVYLDLSTARVHGAKESAINAWYSPLTILRGFQVWYVIGFWSLGSREWVGYIWDFQLFLFYYLFIYYYYI